MSNDESLHRWLCINDIGLAVQHYKTAEKLALHLDELHCKELNKTQALEKEVQALWKLIKVLQKKNSLLKMKMKTMKRTKYNTTTMYGRLSSIPEEEEE